MSRLRVRTPSRLHFGLFGLGTESGRQFGGVGLMVDDPGLEVLVEPSDSWDARGPLSDRARALATDLVRRLAAEGHPVGPVRVTTLRAPEAHVGLGVGTQLSLAVARALTELAGLPDTPVETLARLTGRGRRSGIGIHGFREGGLIVDGGRLGPQPTPTRLLRYPFPRTWSVLLIIPERGTGLSGADEVRAFEQLPPIPDGATDRLCRLVLLGLLPAILETDLGAFGQALTEMQEIVGATFAPAQGGRYSSPIAEPLVSRLKDLGLTGIGQSSWGPALYAFTDAGPDSRDAIRETLRADFQLPADRVFWTRASETGATCPTD
jgi:beta-RFAP synthase